MSQCGQREAIQIALYEASGNSPDTYELAFGCSAKATDMRIRDDPWRGYGGSLSKREIKHLKQSRKLRLEIPNLSA